MSRLMKLWWGHPLDLSLPISFCVTSKTSFKSMVSYPAYDKRYVDDTLTIMPNENEARQFLQDLNQIHPSLKFTMELENNGVLPFLGIQLINKSPNIKTKVYVKHTSTGLLLHYKSHVDARYKSSLINHPWYNGLGVSHCHGNTSPMNVNDWKLCFVSWNILSIWSRQQSDVLTPTQELLRNNIRNRAMMRTWWGLSYHSKTNAPLISSEIGLMTFLARRLLRSNPFLWTRKSTTY